MNRDMRFASSLTEAWLDHSPRAAILMMVSLFALFASFVAWASYTELEISTRGNGTVVPSESVYVVDNLEGGILAGLKVEEGQQVRTGDVLLRIDNSSFEAALKENQQEQRAIEVTLMRLNAERLAQPFESVAGDFSPEVVNSEIVFARARNQRKSEKADGYQRQIEESTRELHETESAIVRLRAEVAGKKLNYDADFVAKAPEAVEFETEHYKLRRSYQRKKSSRLSQAISLLRKEYQTNKELLDAGAASEVDVLRLRRKLLEAEGELSKHKEDFLHKATQELKDRRARLIEQRKGIAGLKSSLIDLDKEFQSEISGEIREAETRLVLLREKQVSLKDKVDRSAVISPMDGVVNKVHVSSEGAVIRPGEPILEIVPATDSLLVEVEIAPRDIAFVRPKQAAVVKVSAYDFAIYGGLDGEVEVISPDIHKRDDGTPFYKVQIRTLANFIGDNKEHLIIPGMGVEADLISGKRSVLDFLLKPLRRMSEEALRER